MNLIPASIIGIHSGQTKPIANGRGGGLGWLLGSTWMNAKLTGSRSHAFAQVISAVTDQMECLLASNYSGRTQCCHLLFTRKTKPNCYFEYLNASHCSFPACLPSLEGIWTCSMLVLPDSFCEHHARRAPGKVPCLRPSLGNMGIGLHMASTWPPGQPSCLPRTERFLGAWSFQHQPWGSWGQTETCRSLYRDLLSSTAPSLCPLLTTGLNFFKKCSQFFLGMGGGLSPKLEFYSPGVTTGSTSAHPLSTTEGEASPCRPSHWPRFCLIPAHSPWGLLLRGLHPRSMPHRQLS